MVSAANLQLLRLCLFSHHPAAGTVSPNDTSCAKLMPPLAPARAPKAASHFLHLLVLGRNLEASVTFTFFSAKCQPHHVSHSDSFRFHDALRTRWEVFPFLPTAQHCSWPGVLVASFLFFCTVPMSACWDFDASNHAPNPGVARAGKTGACGHVLAQHAAKHSRGSPGQPPQCT